MNVRTVKYRFTLCSLREVAAGQSLPSASLNPLRNALPGSLQVHFRATSAPPHEAQWPAFTSRGNEPPEASREHPHTDPRDNHLSCLANNVSTERLVPGSSAIRMLARTLLTSHLLMVWPRTGALPPLIPAHDRRQWNQDWRSFRKEFVALQPLDSREVFDRRCAGDQQDVRGLLKKPCKRDLHRRGP